MDYEPPKQLNPLGVFLVVFVAITLGFPIVLFALWIVTGLMLVIFE